ncbi:MAG: hypothetical protein ABWY20_15870 [Mycobacterium sp.]
MTTPPPPAATSAAAVVDQLSLAGGATPDNLEKVAAYVAAVNRFVRRLPVDPADEDVQLGARMLAARLYKRRNSAEGVTPFTGDTIAYVQRNDPDVALLLGLGKSAAPVVG